MKVSGFTIVRRGEYYAYPFREAIMSILPLCDEMIVNVGCSEDRTLEMVKSIDDKRIKIFESEWDMSLTGGKVLSVETNKALKMCTGDWCFYIQSDELLHEKYHEVVRTSMKKFMNTDSVEGLRFRYKHFYGSYDYYQDNYRNWYIKESRIIKRNDDIVSWGDALDFRHRDGSKIKAKDIDAEIYHYGWVRPPDRMISKRTDFEYLYNKGEQAEKNIAEFQNYDDLGNLKRFTGTHPAVMKDRISASKWNFDPKIELQKPDWVRKIFIFLHPLTKRLNSKIKK